MSVQLKAWAVTLGDGRRVLLWARESWRAKARTFRTFGQRAVSVKRLPVERGIGIGALLTDGAELDENGNIKS